MKHIKRPREEVVSDLEGLGIEFAFKGDWVWAFGIGPNPHKKCDCSDCKDMSGKREAIRKLGFKFKRNGDHINDDPQDPHFSMWEGRGSRWGHACEKPIRFKSKGKSKPKDDKPEEEDKPKPEPKSLDESMTELSWD